MSPVSTLRPLETCEKCHHRQHGDGLCGHVDGAILCECSSPATPAVIEWEMETAAVVVEHGRDRIRDLYEQIDREREALKIPLTFLRKQLEADAEPTRYGNRRKQYGSMVVNLANRRRRYQLIDFSDGEETPILIYHDEPTITVSRLDDAVA